MSGRVVGPRSENGRLNDIVVLRCTGIILVVLGHSFPEESGAQQMGSR
jgi:peptidoglycan/LPS O-acetylase OafA/YrhL